MWWCSSYLHKGYIKLHSLLFTLAVLNALLAHQVARLRVVHSRWPCYAKILSRWVHPCLLVGLNTSSHDRNHCSLIKLPHDLLAHCNLCFLVLLKNQLPVHFWLVDELPKLQSCLELCRFTQAFLQPGLQVGKCPFHRLWPENLIMTLIPTDGVLLEVHNWKERYRAWSLIAMANHARNTWWCSENCRAVFLLILKILVPMHCVPTALTFASFIGVGRMSNGWKE
jgi:hypothetical protein